MHRAPEGHRRKSAAALVRAPRRRAGRAGELDASAVRRRDSRRLHLGARRHRHEAHGGHVRARARAPQAGRRGAASATSSSPASPTRRPAAITARAGSSTIIRTWCAPSTRSARRAASSCVSTARVLYPIQVAEKGAVWMKLRASGRPGHGSMPRENNAVAKMGEAVAKLAATRLPQHRTAVVDRYLEIVAKTQTFPASMLLPFMHRRAVANFLLARTPDKGVAAAHRGGAVEHRGADDAEGGRARPTSSPASPRRGSTAARCRARAPPISSARSRTSSTTTSTSTSSATCRPSRSIRSRRCGTPWWRS